MVHGYPTRTLPLFFVNELPRYLVLPYNGFEMLSADALGRRGSLARWDRQC